MEIDLENMSHAELKKLQKDVAVALRKSEANLKKTARIAAEKAAAEFGFSLDQLVEAGPGSKKSGGVAKYRNPKDPTQTWTGRGRKPRWLIEALAAGADLSDLEI